MRQIIALFAISVLVFSGCTGVQSTAKGLDDQAYIEIVGNPRDYSGGVEVTLNGETTFQAEVNKGTAKRPKGAKYAIDKGTHTVKVSYNGEVVYQKKIFIGAQETKQINLP